MSEDTSQTIPGVSVAVVTGGGHGIGRALSKRLADEGIRVVVADLDGAAAEAAAAEFGGIAKSLDVGDEAAVESTVDAIESEIGPIDMFVSNAGVAFGDGKSGSASRDSLVADIDDRWDVSWRVNVMAHVYAARVLVPRMVARGGGHLVSTVSAAGLLSSIGDAAYSVTKHAAAGFAEALAIRHGDEGIKVSIICPQAVATRMLDFAMGPGANEKVWGGADVDGILTPEQVADFTVEGLGEGRFLIAPHPQAVDYFRGKAADYDRWIGGMRKLRRSLLAVD